MAQLRSIEIKRIASNLSGRRLPSAVGKGSHGAVRVGVARDPADNARREAAGHIERGRGLIEEGQLREAIDAFRLGAAADPRSTRARAILDAARAFIEWVIYEHDFPPGARFGVDLAPSGSRSRSLSPVEAFLLSRVALEPEIRPAVTQSSLEECDALLGLRRLREDGFLVRI